MNSCRISGTWSLLLLRVAAIVELVAVLSVIHSICLPKAMENRWKRKLMEKHLAAVKTCIVQFLMCPAALLAVNFVVCSPLF
jgi:hypothetical protein